MTTIEWKKIDNNSILEGKDFYISYNPCTDNRFGITDIANVAAALARQPEMKDGEETALFHEKKNIWYLLEGDFRKEYEVAFPKGFMECLAVYKKHKKTNRSNWSTDKK